MTASRIDIFKQILEADPANTAVLFGLAKEYEKAGDDLQMIETLNRYLAAADDQGYFLVKSCRLDVEDTLGASRCGATCLFDHHSER